MAQVRLPQSAVAYISICMQYLAIRSATSFFAQDFQLKECDEFLSKTSSAIGYHPVPQQKRSKESERKISTARQAKPSGQEAFSEHFPISPRAASG